LARWQDATGASPGRKQTVTPEGSSGRRAPAATGPAKRSLSSRPCPLEAARPPSAGPSRWRSTIGSAGIDQGFQRRLDDAGVVIELNRDGLLQDVLSDDLAVAFHRLHAFTLIGEGAFQFDVGGVLVLEAALEPSAHTGQARRIQGQTLLTRHLDRHRIEVAQPRRTTQLASARPHPSRDLGLVARTDLFHVDSNPQGVGEIAHQLAKVDSALRDEIKGNLAGVEPVFGGNQLHLQVAFVDALDAQPARARLLEQVVFLDIEIADSHEASNLLERGEIQRLRGLVRLYDDGADALATVGIDQHPVAAA